MTKEERFRRGTLNGEIERTSNNIRRWENKLLAAQTEPEQLACLPKLSHYVEYLHQLRAERDKLPKDYLTRANRSLY